MRAGVEGYYREHGAQYRNPHEPQLTAALRAAVERWQPDLSAVLDLACGSGEAARALEACGAAPVMGCDPSTGEAWQRRMGRPCLRERFEDIASGAFSGRRWSLIVCSFALHLCPESRLPALIWSLSQCADHLWVVTPHKRPVLREDWGFALGAELVVERVRVRQYGRTGLASS